MVTTLKQGNHMQAGTTMEQLKEPPLKSQCRIKWWNQGTGKGAKTIHRQKITAILEQLHNADPTTMIFCFYSTNKNTPK